ncbi:MAG: polysaccharide ABC transporter ATP-binding protein [Terrimicrobiaceae bacterium]|nr:polysaccharide ABC transporter ATP-binding protein [Terrimicrobiaceae bacterium]
MNVSELINPAASETAAPADGNSGKHVVLALENVSKRFCRDLKRSLFYGVQDIGREVVGLSQRAGVLRKNEFWAVQDVNFELRSGDAVGIVGINGCGKTTLMRIVAGLIKPTTGRVTVRGRLAPLLALGAGFNPVLTGRENVFANMSVLGLTYQEIKDRFDDVVAFSEIGYAIDAPVQTYSSGMVARLGFACAISTQPDILLLDEVLAVGDMNFRRKCLERLFEMRSSGMSLVMVHHSPSILLSIAETALYLRRGEVVDFGPIGSVIQQYERHLIEDQKGDRAAMVNQTEDGDQQASDEAEILGVDMQSATGGPVKPGEDAVIVARFQVKQPIEQLNFTAIVYRHPSLEAMKLDEKPRQVLKMLSRRDGGSLSRVQPGEYEVRIDLACVGLREGVYQVHLKFSRPIRVTIAARRSAQFLVSCDDPWNAGEYYQRRTWSVVAHDGARLHTEKILNTVEAADDLMETD